MLKLKFLKYIKNQDDRFIFRKLIENIYDSIMGKMHDLTSISIKKAIFILSVPMIIEMLMESIFAVVDIYFVSRIGSEAIAAVGLTETVITMIYAIAIGLGIGSSAIISRRIGEKRVKEASKVVGQSIIIAISISLLISIVGILFSKDILYLMGASESIINNYSSYTTIMLCGNSTIILLFVINAIFRSSGNPAISMKVLIVANLLNMILDPLLIFGIGPFPELGITGAAIATTIGRGTAVFYQFYLLFSKNKNLVINLIDFKPVLKTIRNILNLAVAGIGQILILTISWIVLTRIVAIFGSNAIAGYTISIRIVLFLILPSEGIANAAGILVGQNLGAKNYKRAEKSIWLTAKITSSILLVASIILFFLSEMLMRNFSDNSEVIRVGTDALKIFSIIMPVYGYGLVCTHGLNGAGDAINPIKINLLCFLIIQIPLAYYLAIILKLEENGVFYSIILSEILMTSIAIYVIKLGKWKHKIV